MLSHDICYVSVDKDARVLTVNITDVAPVKAYFVRAENAYNITMKAISTPSNSNEKSLNVVLKPVLKAPTYRKLGQNFSFPIKVKRLNATDLESDMEAYQRLKPRIIIDSIKLSGLASVFAWALGGIDVGFAYTAGSVFGAGYLYLLGKKVDVIGYGVSTSQASQSISRKDEILANGRLLMPLFLMLTLVIRHTITDSLFESSAEDSISSSRSIFHLLEKQEFLAAIGGFLTHRLTLFYTEIIGQMTLVDWLRLVLLS
jgi:hypothetical protein